MGWNPSQYQLFSEARLRPALDLLERIDLTEPRQLVDLGCGTGNVTERLAQRWPGARLTGVDSSPAMLAEARRRLPGVHWTEADLDGWVPVNAPDLIFSNAALHWVGDHARLFPRLLGMLRAGGVLAVQMPNNFDAPSHTVITELAHHPAWRDRLGPLVRPSPVGRPEHYHDYLRSAAASIDLWETQYWQVLDGADPVKEWTKGTWLKPFLDALPPSEAARFEADYADRMRAAYPAGTDGRTLFPFRRLFLVARAA
jgi:trans-aconitate 2-methyltransferase